MSLGKQIYGSQRWCVMRKEPVEILSDATNSAVMRHPGRRFPGVLIQGDSLSEMCKKVDRICVHARNQLSPDAYAELNELRNDLWGYLTHYKAVLSDHAIQLPFSET